MPAGASCMTHKPSHRKYASLSSRKTLLDDTSLAYMPSPSEYHRCIPSYPSKHSTDNPRRNDQHRKDPLIQDQHFVAARPAHQLYKNGCEPHHPMTPTTPYPFDPRKRNLLYDVCFSRPWEVAASLNHASQNQMQLCMQTQNDPLSWAKHHFLLEQRYRCLRTVGSSKNWWR